MSKKLTLILLVLALLAVGFIVFLAYNEDVVEIEKEIKYESLIEENDYYTADVVRVSGDSFGAETINNIIDRIFLEFKEMAEADAINLREDDFDFSYYLNISVEDHQTDQYLFYVLNFAEYTGGANANQYVKTIGLDKRSGESIGLSDIVNENLLMDKVVEKLLPLDNEGYLFSGVIDGISFSDLENFYIKDEKLFLLFSKYTIAPGAAGIIDIAIDMSEVEYH